MSLLLDEAALARTYSHPSVADPYDIVTQYRSAMRYPEDASSTAIARELEIPRGRVRPWQEGSKPDPVHAIAVATEHEWLSDSWTPVTRSLSRLVSGLFAGGSISSDNWVPSWMPATDTTRTQLRDDLETSGVGSTVAHSSAKGRATELRANSNVPILGRTLSCAGAPVGPKTVETVTELPDYLATAPESVRREWAALYVRERGFSDSSKATKQITVGHSDRFFSALAALIRDVTGETVTVSERGIVVSAAACRDLGIE